MIAPEKCITGVRIEQDEAVKAAVVIEGERQNHGHDHQTDTQRRRQGHPTSFTVAHPPEPKQKKGNEEEKQLAQQNDDAQDRAQGQRPL